MPVKQSMIKIQIKLGKEMIRSGLDDQIIDFDRINMGQILEESGIPFPEEKRRQGLYLDPTFIIAFQNRKIIGYLEYTHSRDDETCIYISSVQIISGFRNSEVLISLIDNARKQLLVDSFRAVKTHVQKTNNRAIKLIKKFGFELKNSQQDNASLEAIVPRKVIEKSKGMAIVEKWHNNRINSN